MFWMFFLGLILLFVPFLNWIGILLIVLSIIGWIIESSSKKTESTYEKKDQTPPTKAFTFNKEKIEDTESSISTALHPLFLKDKDESTSPSSVLKNIVNTRKGYLLHVTELDNIAYILKNGLLSKRMIENYNINPKMMTDRLSNDLDVRKNTDSYVHLAFDESYSMFAAKLYYDKLKNPVIIKISTDVLDLKNIKISDMNAAANCSKIGDIGEVIKNIDFDKLYIPNEMIDSLDYFKMLKRFKQAEVLVRDRIPKEFFKEIIFPFGTSSKFNNFLGDIKFSEGNTVKILRPSFSKGAKDLG